MNPKHISPLLSKHSVAIAQHLSTLSNEIIELVLQPTKRLESVPEDSSCSIKIDPPPPSDFKDVYETVTSAVQDIDQHLDRGYLESTYREALAMELRERGLSCQTEVSQTIYYKGAPLSYGQSRIDILIHPNIVIELKADSLSENTIYKAKLQCKRYLTQGNYPFGMIVGFPDKSDKDPFICHISSAS